MPARVRVSDLAAEAVRLKAVLDAAPRDRRSDIVFENRQLREYELMLDARQRICDRLEQRPRSLRERLRGPDLELAQAYDSRDGATISIATTQRRSDELTDAKKHATSTSASTPTNPPASNRSKLSSSTVSTTPSRTTCSTHPNTCTSSLANTPPPDTQKSG